MGAFDNTIGAVLISSTITAILYGVTMMQGLTYFRRFPNDRKPIKYLVATMLAIDTLHTLFATHLIYWYMVNNFLNAEALLRLPWSFAAIILATDIQDTSVRLFFLYRVWSLSGRNYFLAISLEIHPYHGAVRFEASSLAQVKSFSWALYVGFSLSLFLDTTLAGLLSLFLFQSRTDFKRTRSLINTLALYTINTGFIVCIVSLCVLITYATMPNNYIFFAFFIPLSKLFVNSFLATLNVRSRLQDGSSRREYGSFSLTKLSGTSSGAGATSGTSQGPVINVQTDLSNGAPKINAVHIQREVYVKGDGAASSIEIDTKVAALEEGA
ncbi:hypothetical protein SCHPADRAFT_439343 [Schizopora paradoxa]|uniref:DUF6534 domain-containing protein n=1 Tax=Schizopora paradoxa TaxID=27342 RepID=A0A0H2RJ74_9AGAM|nr:hypothetical protein SCHPADRAFT_439343 [Schizopora paradoxa]